MIIPLIVTAWNLVALMDGISFQLYITIDVLNATSHQPTAQELLTPLNLLRHLSLLQRQTQRIIFFNQSETLSLT